MIKIALSFNNRNVMDQVKFFKTVTNNLFLNSIFSCLLCEVFLLNTKNIIPFRISALAGVGAFGNVRECAKSAEQGS